MCNIVKVYSNGCRKRRFKFAQFVLTPLQFGVPNSRPRYYCLAYRESHISNSHPCCDKAINVDSVVDANQRFLDIASEDVNADIFYEMPSCGVKDADSVAPIGQYLESACDDVSASNCMPITYILITYTFAHAPNGDNYISGHRVESTRQCYAEVV